MPLLGAHMSVAGGYHRAVDAAAELEMDSVQIFTKNNHQWRARPIGDDDVARFRESIETTGIKSAFAHDSYLINLASPQPDLWQKSLDAFVVELERAEMFGLDGLVMHPGSYTDSSEQEGLEKIVEAFEAAVERTAGATVEIWLETTAGQGTNLGWRFEQLAWLIDHVRDASRLGVCVDTCHIFAAGYPLQAAGEYAATIDELDSVVGVERVRAWHLNDSKRELGSRVDRHEAIGAGCLGLEPFRHVLNDPRWATLPMVLETPKGEGEDGRSLDAANLETLRGLIA